MTSRATPPQPAAVSKQIAPRVTEQTDWQRSQTTRCGRSGLYKADSPLR